MTEQPRLTLPSTHECAERATCGAQIHDGRVALDEAQATIKVLREQATEEAYASKRELIDRVAELSAELDQARAAIRAWRDEYARDSCEGCDRPADGHDPEGTPLCAECGAVSDDAAEAAWTADNDEAWAAAFGPAAATDSLHGARDGDELEAERWRADDTIGRCADIAKAEAHRWEGSALQAARELDAKGETWARERAAIARRIEANIRGLVKA